VRALLNKWLVPAAIRQGDPATAQLAYVAAIYTGLAFLSMAVFGLQHALGSANKSLGYLELAGAVVALGNLLGLQATRNVQLMRDLFLTILLVMLIVMLATGGTQGTGIFWFFIFPVAAFFLTDRRQGVYWMTALFTLCSGFWLLSHAGAVYIYYGDVTVRQLLVCLLVVSVGLYVYEEARERSERQAHKVELAKSEFVTLASHQLRTPISAVKWFSEFLLDDDKLTKEQREHVSQIHESNERMAALVTELLTISSLELGSLPIRAEPAKLATIAHAALEEERAMLTRHKELTIREHYDKDLPDVALDPSLFKLILQHLISNSLKYTPKGGSVSLEITQTTKKVVPGSKGSIAIVLNDSGYGIPKNAQHRVFTKFFRADNAKDKDTDGTGLGLYLIKEVLGHVGGEISFTSTEGTGTTFVVLLPIEGMPAKQG
jgi:signal transduction histidine kinase